MTDLSDLPDEVRQAIEAPVALNEEKLAALAKAITEKRDEAVAARKASGIEDEWLAAEEAYVCIDDSNRSEFAGAKWAKPTSMDGPVTATNGSRAAGVKSNVFVPLTPRYVDAGAAKLGEILLPIDDKAFSFEPTPDPELVKSKSDLSALMHPATGQPMMRTATPEEMQGPPPPGHVPGVNGQSMPQVPVTRAEIAEKLMAQAQTAAKAAERRIYDWLVESRYPAEMRKVIFDGARIGVGILKAPFPNRRTAMAMVDGALEISETIKPCVAWKDPWNCFPDPACGENIQDGDHFVERDFLSRKRLKDMKGQPGYIDANIAKVLLQGPQNNNEGDDRPGLKKNDKRFVVWYFTGTLSVEDMRTAGVQDLPEGKGAADDIYAIATMINDVLVHAAVNPLDSGKLPYHGFQWRRRPGHWAGVGVAEQIRTPQRMINAATRALLNNAGKSAGSQVVIDREGIEPADGQWTLTPDKVWYKKVDAIADDIRKMFGLFEIPNMGAPLMSIIEYAFKLAEESTNIPLVTQGQSGSTTPETYGATQLQDNNANQLLRSIAYSTDDGITEPVVTMFYEWLLLDPEVPDEEKGDFQINAHGSIALVERAIQDETIAQMGQMVKDPAFGIDPKKWFAEFLKTKHLNPTTMQYSAEELAQIAKQPAPPPVPIAVAEIKAKADTEKTQATLAAKAQLTQAEIASAEKIATGEQQVQAHDINSKVQGETVYAQTQAQMAKDNAAAQERLLMIKRDIAMLEYSNKNSMHLEQVKADLAKVSIQEQTKKDLASAELEASATERALDRQHDANKHTSGQRLDAATTLATHAHEKSIQRDQLQTPQTP